ncbi:TPA: IpaC/SipC family type III secretion system effector [Providencia rettgeri]
MTAITAQPTISNKSIFNVPVLETPKEALVLTPTGGCQEISLTNLPLLISTEGSEKPALNLPMCENMRPEQLMHELSNLDLQETENVEPLSSLLAPNIASDLRRVFEQVEQKMDGRVDSVNSDQFIGIASSKIVSEISLLLRKVASQMKISDQRINAAFSVLSGKMVEAAAASTIKEGKKMMEGAIINFSVSLGISGIGAAFQGKSLHTQNKSINSNLKPGINNINTGDKLSQLNGQASALTAKTNSSTMLKGKDGSSIELVDQATMGQKALVGKSGQDAASSTKAYGQNQLNEHNNIATKESVKRSVAEQGTRLSDSAGNMAASPLQADAKEQSANAMIEQEISSAARKVAENADKSISESSELLKKMNEALRDVRDSQIRTSQAVVRG